MHDEESEIIDFQDERRVPPNLKRSIKWETYEYKHDEKNPDWFWSLGILTVAFAFIAILLNDVLFGVIIIMSGLVLALHAIKKPDLVQYEINERGVKMNEKIIRFSSLQTFAYADEDMSRVYLRSKKKFAPIVEIPILTHDFEDVHEILADYVDEDEYEIPLHQKLFDKLGI